MNNVAAADFSDDFWHAKDLENNLYLGKKWYQGFLFKLENITKIFLGTIS